MAERETRPKRSESEWNPGDMMLIRLSSAARAGRSLGSPYICILIPVLWMSEDCSAVRSLVAAQFQLISCGMNYYCERLQLLDKIRLQRVQRNQVQL